jgi:hypothetical protein
MNQLNQGQQLAADGFFKFLFDTDQKEMIIAGPGGVGKTFLMGYLIDTIMPQYHDTCTLMGIDSLYDDVVMTATTNKAAEVLSKSTGRPSGTIHSFLNLRVKDDFSTGQSSLVRTQNWVVRSRTILFIDECSMIDKALYRAIREGTMNCKIIYVGDRCQLSPVKEVLSPVYLNNLPYYELTEPMRNADQPALMALCQQLRDTVNTGVFTDIQTVPGVIDHLNDAQMEHEVSQFFPENKGELRLLAYTNVMVNQYNGYIREKRTLPSEVTEGEVLINNSSFRQGDQSLSVEEEITIVRINDTYEKQITSNVSLMVQDCCIKTSFDQIIVSAMVPVDKHHYGELVKYFARQKNWERYFFLKNSFVDLRPRDASTVHKAQGSTCDTVYIDLSDLSVCTQSDQVARLLYVAVTRPRNRVVFYNQLADRFNVKVQ